MYSLGTYSSYLLLDLLFEVKTGLHQPIIRPPQGHHKALRSGRGLYEIFSPSYLFDFILQRSFIHCI